MRPVHFLWDAAKDKLIGQKSGQKLGKKVFSNHRVARKMRLPPLCQAAKKGGEKMMP